MGDSAKVLVKFVGDTKDLDSATSKASRSLGGLKGVAKGVGGAIAAGIATAVAVATNTLIDLSKQSLKARADLEQNLGGVETLFKDNADKVVANAKEAYKTAGVSANEYMAGVTSFAASLLQSTAGDTAKAADVADMAFKDMSDNANKFGTDMGAIQNAYQGFAKQNYTMLDNLKLGYGGTKTEMERLLSDAEKLTGVKYDISNLKDVYKAIHAIQDNLGVTGTTAEEATKTISGSINMAKKSFENFLAGVTPAKDVVTSVVTAAKRVASELVKILPDIANGIVEIINGLIPMLPGLIQTLVPVFVTGVLTMLQGIMAVLPQIIDALIQALIQIITALAEMLPTLIPTIVEAILGIIPVLIDNLPLFIEAGYKLIIGILSGIIQSVPKLIAFIPKLISSIVKYFLSLPKTLWRIGVNAIKELGKAFINNLKWIVDKAKNIGKKVIDAIKNFLNPSNLLDIGKNLVKGLWNGINNAKDWVLGKIKGFGKSVLNGIKSFFGISSPSKVMFEIGGYLDEGFVNGIEDMKDDVEKAINGTFCLKPNVANSANTHISPQINVINNIHSEMDPLGQVVNTIKTFQSGAKNDYNYGKA